MSLSKKLITLTKSVWATGNDLCLGIRTVHNGQSKTANGTFEPTKYNDGTIYEAVDYWNIRRAIRRFGPSREDVFYDIGCGMGRIVCSAARFRMRKVVGIEIDRALCEMARKNAERLRGRNSPIEIRCEDAAAAGMSDGTVYFMFNPFGDRTMQEVLKNISSSLLTNPRSIVIAYFNPKSADLLDSCNWLIRGHQFKTLSGAMFLSWRTPAR